MGYYDLEETKAAEGFVKNPKATYRLLVDDKGSIGFYIFENGIEVRHYDIKEYETHVGSWFYDINNLIRIENRQEPMAKFAFYKRAESTTSHMAELYDRNLEAKFKLTKDGDRSFKALE